MSVVAQPSDGAPPTHVGLVRLSTGQTLLSAREVICAQLPKASADFEFLRAGVAVPADREGSKDLSACTAVLLRTPAAWPPLFAGQDPVSVPDPTPTPTSTPTRSADADRNAGAPVVYVGGLAPGYDADTLQVALWELLTQAGPCVRVDLPRRADGGHRGFGFGEFESLASAKYAAALLDGVQLNGLALRARLRK